AAGARESARVVDEFEVRELRLQLANYGDGFITGSAVGDDYLEQFPGEFLREQHPQRGLDALRFVSHRNDDADGGHPWPRMELPATCGVAIATRTKNRDTASVRPTIRREARP